WRGPQQHVEVGFGEISVPGISRFDNPRVYVDADHIDATARQSRGSRQADITETDDAHGLDRVVHHSAPEKGNSRSGTTGSPVCDTALNTREGSTWQAVPDLNLS